MGVLNSFVVHNVKYANMKGFRGNMKGFHGDSQSHSYKAGDDFTNSLLNLRQ